MDREKGSYRSIDEYIRSFPEQAQRKLTQLRELVRRIAPEAEERISYGMPAFYLNGNLVYFAAHAHHIGFYPTSSGIERYKSELAVYPTSKGAVRFAMEAPLPLDLIERIVRFRVEECSQREAKKRRRGGPADGGAGGG